MRYGYILPMLFIVVILIFMPNSVVQADDTVTTTTVASSSTSTGSTTGTSDAIISKEQTEQVTSGSNNSSVPISITDVCSINGVSEGKKLKLKFGETGTEATSEATTASTGSGIGLFDEVGDLEVEYTKDLTGTNGVTARFPSTVVGSADISTLHDLVQSNQSSTSGQATDGATMKPILYGMLLDLDMFQSNMYSSWINIDGDGGNYGSLEWWNGWLSTNGYSYNIDKNKLLNSTSEQYNFDVTGNGYIMLDLDTIQNIKSLYDKQDLEDTIRNWRTFYKLLGFVLFGYALLLQVAWLVDTQFGVGMCLTVLTGGKWRAVTDKSTVTDKESTTQYLTYSGVFMRSVVIIALGSLLVFTDPIHLIDTLLALLGNISTIIERATTGG